MKTYKCLNCETECTCRPSRNNKYCSNKCQGLYQRKLIFERIRNGDVTLHETNYRNYLIEEYGAKCMECGWCEVNTSTGLVPIQLEHIDGNSDNNSLDNLKLLCPNCHSLTPTFGRLNKNGRNSLRNKKRQQKRKE